MDWITANWETVLMLATIAVVMIVIVILIHLARLDARRCHHRGALEARRRLEPLHPALEAEPVDEEDVRASQLLGVGGRGVEFVRIAVGTDELGDLDPVAADILHHVGENAERGDGLELVGSVRRIRDAERQDRDGEEGRETETHGRETPCKDC